MPSSFISLLSSEARFVFFFEISRSSNALNSFTILTFRCPQSILGHVTFEPDAFHQSFFIICSYHWHLMMRWYYDISRHTSPFSTRWHYFFAFVFSQARFSPEIGFSVEAIFLLLMPIFLGFSPLPLKELSSNGESSSFSLPAVSEFLFSRLFRLSVFSFFAPHFRLWWYEAVFSSYSFSSSAFVIGFSSLPTLLMTRVPSYIFISSSPEIHFLRFRSSFSSAHCFLRWPISHFFGIFSELLHAPRQRQFDHFIAPETRFQ